MAVGPSTTSTLNELLPQIVAEAMFVASERSIMRGLVRNFNLAQGQGKTVTVPIYPLQTAAPVAEGSLIDSTEVDTSGATLTVSTAAIRTLVTDLSVASAASNVVADLGRLFGEAMARKIDTDLTGLFYTLSSGEGNWGATPIAPADIFKAVAKLKAAAVPTDGMVCVLHPAVAYDLKSALTTNGNTPFTMGAFGDTANEAMRMGYVGQLAGIPVFETSNIALKAAGEPGEYAGAVFHRDALGLAMIGDISVEVNRRPEYLGTDVIGYCHYGVGKIYDSYAKFLAFDATI